MNHSESLDLLMGYCKALAIRWIKAWPSTAGYNSVGNVGYNAHDKTITFHANPITSGIEMNCSISANYLDDSKSLEADSLKEYSDKQKKVKAHFDRIDELEKTPEAIEYKKLKNTDIHGTGLFLSSNHFYFA